ncbi:BRD4-interacting chromatin-remodeling complex-associated protein-like isoform X2 [Mixophyes fleayi]|uniref:BRD4-interacting chromatin-remodeling complex-associated protein-like isoform X2 n=1 Tax=Mixophyes fleayi TaxID=3061075 RepID=UPI003F4D8C9D
MDDDDDSGLLDFIGDHQALNYFLHGSDNKTLADAKSSIKGVQSLVEEESSDRLQLSNSIQFFEDALDSSPIPDLSEDILQKSLQEANITEQILAEEAYLDASIGSSQQFANVPLHSHSSASFTQATSAPTYSGQTLHPIGVPVVPHQVGAPFASNTVGPQHGFMQHVGIIPSQHMPNSNQNSSGQIHLIGSINNQSPMMTINNLDGSQIILKSGQQAPANASGGLLMQRQTPNGNAMFGSPNASPGGHPVTVPFNSGNFQTSLPVHNIIIHRGPAPNASKAPINIQPKPVQVGQPTSYNVNHLGMHHHRQQGVHFVPANSTQSSPMGQKMPGNHQGPHKPSSQQSGGIVIHSPLGHQHGHPNQFLIPTGLSVNSSSVQHIQTINNQLVQGQPSHLGPHQVPADHVMLNRNTAPMVRPSQQYPGQMLNNSGTAVQLVSGQAFTGAGGQVIFNHGPSQIVGGQMTQLSPTLLHLSPGQGNTAQGRSSMSSTPSGCQNMSTANRFTVLSSGTMLQSMGPSFQSPGGGENYIAEQQQNRPHSAVNESHLPASSAMSNNMFCPNTGSQQSFSCNQGQNKMLNHLSPVSSLKNQQRQTHVPDHNSGNKHLQHHLLSQEALMGSQLQNAEPRPVPPSPLAPSTTNSQKPAELVLPNPALEFPTFGAHVLKNCTLYCLNCKMQVSYQSLQGRKHARHDVQPLGIMQTPFKSNYHCKREPFLKPILALPYQLAPYTTNNQTIACTAFVPPNPARKFPTCADHELKNCRTQVNNQSMQEGKHAEHEVKALGIMQKQHEVEGYPGGLKRPAVKQLTKEALIAQQLHKDQERSVLPDKTKFQSLDDAAQRLLPYHVFQGSLPTEEDLQKVDNEFESTATHLLKKTQAMLNKYRLLLMEDAMRINPSAEMVMLDRMFNQEERAGLTREKRMSVVDPDGYLAEFCCATQFQEVSSDVKPLSNHNADADPTLACPLANVSEDKTDLRSPKHDKPCLVPNNNLSSHKRKNPSDEIDSLNRDSTSINLSLSPCQQLTSIYRLKGKYSECSSDPDASCRTSKGTDAIVDAQLPIPVSGSNKDRGDVGRPQSKTPGPSLETAGQRTDTAASPEKHCKSLARSKTVKATVRNVVELKLSAKRLKSEVATSNSAELEFVKRSAAGSEDNCGVRQGPEAREGAAETDSVLEAAVNSILEC